MRGRGKEGGGAAEGWAQGEAEGGGREEGGTPAAVRLAQILPHFEEAGWRFTVALASLWLAADAGSPSSNLPLPRADSQALDANSSEVSILFTLVTIIMIAIFYCCRRELVGGNGAETAVASV